MSPTDGSHEPRPPLVTLSLVVLNLLVFLYELSLGPDLARFIYSFGTIPTEIVNGQDTFPEGPVPIHLTLITGMFLHAGWAHLIGNMIFLWFFGSRVEGSIGAVRFLAFYLLGGTGAALIQAALTPASAVPSIGASGAVAAVLGGFLALYVGGSLHSGPPLPALIRLAAVSAILLLSLWALIQLFAGIVAGGLQTQQIGGVAYWAHLGGFAVGVLASGLFRRRPFRRFPRRA